MSKQKYYYVTGNTAQGFVNYLSTNLRGIEQIIVLKHVSHTLKTSVLQQLLKQFTDSNELIEVLCSPFGNEYIEGIIMRNQSLAVITDTVMTTAVKDVQEVELNDLLPSQYKASTMSTDRLDECREEAYVKLAKALKVHDDLEKIYIQEMDFDKANELTNQFINRILQGISKQKRTSHIYQRLFGTNTDRGPVNQLTQIIEPLSKRIYIKGRAGTGKSVFMKKVIKACKEYHFDIEQYHCSFDSNSIDMVLVPDLDLCVFDSTAPHEFLPERKGDMIIDLYKETVTPGTDEKYAKEIDQITKKYKAILREGIEDLKQAKHWQNKQEQPYVKIDYADIVLMAEKIISNIIN